jgi:hypothetical protein
MELQRVHFVRKRREEKRSGEERRGGERTRLLSLSFIYRYRALHVTVSSMSLLAM